jgi:hypothetical protein
LIVSWAVPGPVGAACAGAATPRTVAANPPANKVANPSFFIVVPSSLLRLLGSSRFAAAVGINPQDQAFNSIGRI